MNTPLTRRSALKGITLGAGGALLNPVLSQLVAHAAGREGVALKVQRGRKEIVVTIKAGDGR